LTQDGHEIKISDLYAMNFKPAVDVQDFPERVDPKYFNVIMEQKNACAKGELSFDVKEEQNKVRWADFLLFQYPLWWFSMPAMLKGWIDRVFMTGFAWDFGKMYAQGLLAGKKGMLSVTTGGDEAVYQRTGGHGWDIDQVLHPVNHGVLYFCGVRPLPPFVSYAVFQATDAKRKQYLEDYKKRLHAIDSTELIKY
jgi:NAD(P)H dehydrogenase (quinone)